MGVRLNGNMTVLTPQPKVNIVHTSHRNCNKMTNAPLSLHSFVWRVCAGQFPKKLTMNETDPPNKKLNLLFLNGKFYAVVDIETLSKMKLASDNIF